MTTSDTEMQTGMDSDEDEDDRSKCSGDHPYKRRRVIGKQPDMKEMARVANEIGVSTNTAVRLMGAG